MILWGFIVEILTLLVDIGILWILIEEFNYDKIQVEKKHYRKRIKVSPQFEHLNNGEMK